MRMWLQVWLQSSRTGGRASGRGAAAGLIFNQTLRGWDRLPRDIVAPEEPVKSAAATRRCACMYLAFHCNFLSLTASSNPHTLAQESGYWPALQDHTPVGPSMAAVSSPCSVQLKPSLCASVSSLRPRLPKRRHCETVTAAFTRRDVLAATAASSGLTLSKGEANLLGGTALVGLLAIRQESIVLSRQYV